MSTLLAAARRRERTAGGGGSYDLVENFEVPTTGYENTGWTTYNSSNPAYTTGPLQGSQSLYSPTGSTRGAYRTRTATGEVWLYWQWKLLAGIVNDYHFYIDSAFAVPLVGFASGKIRLRIAGSNSDDAGAFPTDTLVHTWVRYKPGSGNASGDLYWSTDGIRGSPKCSLSGKTQTTEMDRPRWLSRNTYAVLWDRIIINATPIGDNP